MIYLTPCIKGCGTNVERSYRTENAVCYQCKMKRRNSYYQRTKKKKV